MAKRIEGITIEIDGNTTGLSTALKGVNSNISSANSELRKLDGLLKLNPGNTELVAQKQQVLANAIKETTEKLSQLKAQQENVNKSFAEGKIDEATYREFNREVIATEGSLRDLNSKMTELNKSANDTNFSKAEKELEGISKVNFDGVSAGLKEVGKVAGDVAAKIGKSMAVGIGVATTAIAGLVGKSVKMAGDLEQQIGGTEAVFGDFATTVQEASTKAYNTMGISANNYMATINKMGSLMQGSGIEQEKAMDLSAAAMQRAADVASIMGIDVNMAMESIAGAAKGNFTMMDNLGVAMNATAIQSYALSKGITKSYSAMSKAEQVGLAMEMFLEQSAYATGNYAKENETLAGSFSTLKASFDNFLSGAGEVEPFIDSLLNAADILLVKILEMTPKIIEGLSKITKSIIEKMPTFLKTIVAELPKIITMIVNLLPVILPALIQLALDLVMGIVNILPTMLPLILQTLLDGFLMIITSLAEALPDMIPAIIAGILSMIPILIDNLPLFVDAGIALMFGIMDGLLIALPMLIDELPVIIDKIVMVIMDNLPKIIQAGYEITAKLAWGLIKAIPQLWTKVPQIIETIVKGLLNGLGKIAEVGVNLVEGLWNGIKNSFTWIKNKIKGWVGDVMAFIKKLFGIASPSKIMEKQVGLNLGLGIAKGIDDSIGQVQDAMGRLSSGVTTSVNPIINPTANSNPLILNIENFNNTRQTDVQALMEEAEFYRKNTAIAVGGR